VEKLEVDGFKRDAEWQEKINTLILGMTKTGSEINTALAEKVSCNLAIHRFNLKL
jgi:hypothetical protein